MRPTTLFSNHDEILRSAEVRTTDDRVVPANEPAGKAADRSSAFSIFNSFSDESLRASRGFHMSAKLLVVLAAAGTFGAYVLARESKPTTPTVVQQEPVQVPQSPAVSPLISPMWSPRSVNRLTSSRCSEPRRKPWP